MNHKSFILASCFFQYLGPIIVIIGCYYFIVRAVFNHEDELRQQAKKMNVTSLRSGNQDQDAVSAEIRAAKVAVVNITLWIFAWTPFAVVSMLGTWYDGSFVTPLMSELPVVFAKTSALYNPIIYALSHPKYRECLKELYPWLCITVGNNKTGANRSNRPGGDDQSTNSTKTEASGTTQG